MNTAEGINRLATVIRWLGDGIGILLVILFIALEHKFNTSVFALVTGALISGAGRAIGWILQGFAKDK